MPLNWKPGRMDRYQLIEQAKRDRYGFPGYVPGVSPRPALAKTLVDESTLGLTHAADRETTST